MQNAVILHGTDETPDYMWLPWVKDELVKMDYQVSIPQLPEAEIPQLEKWLPVALQQTYTQQSILISHSAGGPLLLSVLENLTVRIKQAILVAGYARVNKEKPKPELILQDAYNWEKIAENVDEIIFLNSDNDPWGCDDVEGKYMLDQVGKGKLVVMKGEGHMGSEKFNQPYNEFPFLLKLIG